MGAVLLAGGLVAVGGPAHADVLPAAGCTTATPGASVTCTFRFTGDRRAFTVPAGVSAVTLTARGGAGGMPISAASSGGSGATVSGTFPVSPGDQLGVFVGGHGEPFSNGGGVEHGYGYGTGGAGSDGAGQGGGSSAVTDGDTVLLVAGGGGGGGASPVVVCPGGEGGFADQQDNWDGNPGLRCRGVGPAAGGTMGAQPSPDGGAAVPGPGGTGGGGGGGGGYRGGSGGEGYVVASDGLQSGAGGGGAGSNYQNPWGTALSAVSTNAAYAGLVQVTYQVPPPAPVAAPQVGPGQPNAAGWYTAPVSVDWGWTEAGAAVTGTGCTQSTSSAGDGIQTLSAACRDAAGNLGAASTTVKVDSSKPVDNPVVTKTAQQVSVAWHWTDATSGVDPHDCQQTTWRAGSTGLVTVDSVCTDLAGNAARDSVTVDNDRWGPGGEAVVTPRPNANGWNDSDVSVAWNWIDSGSGVDPTNCTQRSTSSGEGAALAVSATCSDLDGNVGSDSVGVKVDKTAPVDSPVVTTTATGASVAWNWSDALSGVDASSCTQSSSQSGTGQLTLTSSCTDLAGNTASDSKTVTVTPPVTQADVQVTLTGSRTARRDTSTLYTVTVTNAGPGAAVNVGSQLQLPDGATVVSAGGSPVWLGRALTWSVPKLASGASESYAVSARFPRSATWVLGATVASLPTSTTSATQDPDPLNNIATLSIRTS